MRRTAGWAAVFLASVLGVGCAEDSADFVVPTGLPVGTPLLPDLVPEPPDVLQMLRDEQGRWSIRFTSVLVNVGEGEFVLDGIRSGGEWAVEQAIVYSTSGTELVPLEAEMVWGGDGHEHWHVSRVASYRLEPLEDPSQTSPGANGREDTKIGFCFFDSGQELNRGPDEAQFGHEGCGDQDDEEFLMGLSPGWGDTYPFGLPGQSIDVSDLPDGNYRLWALADEQGWFREITRENNLTWVDFELETLPTRLRTAKVVSVGPVPE